MRVSRWLLGLTLLLAVIVPAQAQQAPSVSTKTLTSTDCPGTGCLIAGTAGYGGIGVMIENNGFTASVIFEGIVSTDTTKTWQSVNCTPYDSSTPVSEVTEGGQWGCAVGGLSYFRVRLTDYSSGNIIVTTRPVTTLSRNGGGGGGGTISGTIVAGQVAVGSGADAIGGSSLLTFDGTYLTATANAERNGASLSTFGTLYSSVETEDHNGLELYNWTYDGSFVVKLMDNGTVHANLPDVASTFQLGGRLGINDLTGQGGNALNYADKFIVDANGSIQVYPTLAGGEAYVDVFNQSNTTGAGAKVYISNNGDTADGPVALDMRQHTGGADEAAFTITLAGDSGNNTPATTFTFPGSAQFTFADENMPLRLHNTAFADGWTMRVMDATGDLRFIGDGGPINFAYADGAVTLPASLTVTGLTSTGAATGKKVVCVDTATGVLYASSTGTDCSN